ncbi:MAG: gamma-glutamyltransferase, partial [Sediminibacterium sp.]
MKKWWIIPLIGCASLSVSAQNIPSIVGKGKAIDPYKYSIVKKANYQKAAVSSAHPLASQVGAMIMKQGGNAFDAAIATQLALAVVYPAAGNIGGGGFLLARKKDGELIGLDYREAAPEASNRDMYLDEKGNARIALSQNGHLA